MPNQPVFFLIGTGTSILTNSADKPERDLVFRHANKRKLEDIPKDDAAALQGLCSRAKQEMLNSDSPEARRRSAELNSLLAYYGNHRPGNDIFCFVITDTWLADQSFDILQTWLTNKFSAHITIDKIKISDLQTANEAALQMALSDLVKKVSEELGYRKYTHHIVFNLTGGFKVILAFLQTLGQFYADEMIYLFETAQELMRIPRLPLKWEPEKVVSENFATLRKLALGLKVPEHEIKDIPETLLFRLDGDIHLSAWGEIVFEATREELYRQNLHESPCEKIIFTDSFRKSVENLQPNRMREINTRIDDLVRFRCANGANPKRLDFKALKGKHDGFDHEFDAWADGSAMRVFCQVKGDKVELIKLGDGLH